MNYKYVLCFIGLLTFLFCVSSVQAQFIYGVGTKQDSLIKYNPDTGSATEIGSLGIKAEEIGCDFACDGTLWAFSRSEDNFNLGLLYTVDLDTGKATVQQEYDLSDYSHLSGIGIEFGPDEENIYWRAKENVVKLNIATGEITPAFDLTPYKGWSLTMPPGCEEFYSADYDGNNIFLAKINPQNGNRTEITTLDTARPFPFAALTSTPDGKLYGFGLSSGEGYIWEININTGQTYKISGGFHTAGLAYGPENVVCCANQPPVCPDAYPDTKTIWPANHKFVDIGIEGVTDPDGDNVTITVTDVYQDEPVNSLGDGSFSPDAIIDNGIARIRAERSGNHDGRVYHIGFLADDGNGGTCRGTVKVCVPHDRFDTDCDDGGALYDSTKE